jgi:ATP-dependent RNA helicase HelY
MVATFARHRGPDALRAFVDASLRAHLAARQVAGLRADLAHAEATVCEGSPVSDTEDPSQNEVSLSHVRPGDVIEQPGRPSAGVMAVIGEMRTRRGVAAVDVVGEDARRTTLDVRSLRATPVVVGHIELPDAGGSPRGFSRQVTELLRAAPKVMVFPARAAPRKTGGRDADRAAAAVTELRDRIAVIEHDLADELAAYVALLRRRRHLDGWQLTPSGTALARLFHDAGLLVAEALRNGLFDDLSPAETAAFASAFTPRGGLAEHGLRAPTPRIAAALRTAEHHVRALNQAEDDLGLAHTPSPNPALCGVVYRWCERGDLAYALQGSDVRAGDLVREVRQVAELLEQVCVVAPPPLAGTCADAIARLNRGIVVDEIQIDTSAV